MKIKKFPIVKLILIALTLVSSVKVAMCGWIIDEGYAFAIGNRLLQGDLLFRDMWELHQTSGFAVEFFLWIYRNLTGTYDGEILFVRICGILLHLLVSAVFYLTLKKHISPGNAFILAVIFANLSPKQTSTPEFSNLFNLTSLMTLVCIDALDFAGKNMSRPHNDGQIEPDTQKPGTLHGICKPGARRVVILSVLAGVFLSLCVLSYPQSVIFALFVFIYLFVKRKQNRAAFPIVFSVCLLSGLAYLGHILTYMSFSSLIETAEKMIYVDSTHGEGISKIALYGKDLLGVLLFSAGFGLVSFGAGKLFKNKKIIVPVSLLLVFSWKFIHYAFRTDYYPVELTFGGILFVIIIALVYIMKNINLTDDMKSMLLLYGGGSLACFVTVLIACDQSIFSSAKYLTYGLVAILAVVFEAEGSCKKGVTLLAVVLVIFVNIIQLNNPRNKLFNIFDSGARVPYGPEKGLVLERIYANKARIDADELPELLDQAERVMITGDAVTYLYTDARIGHGSTIMTEDYGIRFASYWEMYPEKMPDIIAVECYDGELNSDVENSWLYRFASGEFGAKEVVDTTYYRLYIR